MSHMPPNVFPIGITDTVLSVKNYGAVGSGVADDTAALEAALAATTAGVKLRFPPGTYRCTRTLTPLEGAILVGEGGEIAFVDDGSASGIRMLVQVDDVTIQGLRLRDTAAARTAVYGLISINNCARARVVDCVLGNSASTGVWTSRATDFEIRGNTVSGTLADGIHVSRGSTRGVIANNVVRGTGDDAIAVISLRTYDGVNACNPCSHVAIVGNVISAPTPIGRGIALDGSRHITVTGNTISDTPNQGILAGGGGTQYYPAFLTIRGNTIDAPTSAGIHITYTRGLIVEGNNIYHSSDVGISLLGAQHSSRVCGNVITRCPRSVVITQTASATATLLADLFTNLGDTAPATMITDRLAIKDNIITAQSGATSVCLSVAGESGNNSKRVAIAGNILQVITGGTGIQLTFSEDAHIAANIINGDNKGIRLAEVDRATVEGNRLNGCYLEHTTNGTQSTICRNTIYGATSSAIYVEVGTTGTYVLDNDVRNSSAMTLASGTISSRNIGDTVTTIGAAATDTIVATAHIPGALRFASSTGPVVRGGSGSPEGAVTAAVGSIYFRSDGGASTSLYVKESGTGNTGWVGK